MIGSSAVATLTERQAILGSGGVRTIPVVVGETITDEAEEHAKRNAVAILQDESDRGWETALAAL
jgi:hypothetical protein